jgi:predicted component of type VI protein secretion system
VGGSGNGQRTFTIGRAPDCDLVLADESVSRRHAELLVIAGGEVFVTDCRSTHGTVVLEHGAERRHEQGVVAPQASLRFGDITMSVAEILQALGSPLPHRSATADGAPRHGRTWPRGVRLVRCACGAIKPRGQACAECRE